MTTNTLIAPDGFSVVRERLHTLLWRQKISHARAATALGVTASTFGKKLRGETVMTVPELIALADLLDVEPSELLEGVRHQGLEPRTHWFEAYLRAGALLRPVLAAAAAPVQPTAAPIGVAA